jgi:sn-glycerol 3-phosphate transport system permease protein
MAVTDRVAPPPRSPFPSREGGWGVRSEGARLFGRILVRGLGYLAMLLAVAAVGLPLLWLLSAAFKPTPEIYVFPPTWIPNHPTLDNFARAWRQAPFDRFYVNSTIVTLADTASKMLNAVLCAYAFAFLRFPRKDLIFLLVIAALMVPAQVTILPNYLTMAGWGLVNTLQGIILPQMGVAFGTFLMRQHFLTLPREVLEASTVDGASHLQTLFQVVLPMSRPTLITFGLLTLVGRWNDFLWPLIVTNTANMRTLPIGLYFLLDSEGNTQWGSVMAGTLFVIAPVLVVFLFAQRYIVAGIAAGAVKG